MRLDTVSTLWLGIACLATIGSALPTTIQGTNAVRNAGNGASPADVDWLSVASTEVHARSTSDDIEKRGKKKTSKPQKPGSGSQPPPQKSQPQNPTGGRQAPKDRTKPDKAPNKEKNGKGKSINLGVCGTADKGKTIYQESQSSSPAPKGKGKGRAGSQSPSIGRRAKNGASKATARVCNVPFKFPDYPANSEAIVEKPDKWKSVIEAYNAEVIDPCKDDYRFGKKKYPTTKTDGVWGRAGSGRTDDNWQTEHIMDAQIMSKFFKDTFDVNGASLSSALPRAFISNVKGNMENDPTPCKTLEQFWVRRWNTGVPDVMQFLLSEYPGDNEYKNELVLLPGRINNRKNTLFTVQKEAQIIAPKSWKAFTFHQKIDNLRELVLLAKYLNTPKIAKAFHDVSIRISKRLAYIEDGGPNAPAHIRETDNFYFEEAGDGADPALKDAADGKYKSFGLSNKWDKFIYKLVKDRTDAMYALQLKYHKDLEALYREMKTYDGFKKLSAAEKTDIQKRMTALGKEIKTKVAVDKLVSRPANLPPSRQNSGSSGSGSRNSSPGRGPSNS